MLCYVGKASLLCMPGSLLTHSSYVVFNSSEQMQAHTYPQCSDYGIPLASIQCSIALTILITEKTAYISIINALPYLGVVHLFAFILKTLLCAIFRANTGSHLSFMLDYNHPVISCLQLSSSSICKSSIFRV